MWLPISSLTFLDFEFAAVRSSIEIEDIGLVFPCYENKEVDFFKENAETRNGRQRVVADEYKKKDYISDELPVHPLVSGSKATKPLNTLPDPTTLEYKDTGLRWSL
ncbi:hypothetical protein V6N12_027239 [Hibiscus sabdariffa]|uniref:Uncharacterized protein n=1 Tax=Hibiscus sabdariffa TaxID=183260 RepID=A0ABR2DVT7_9ROSI